MSGISVVPRGRPCHHDENSRAKVQNVRTDSSDANLSGADLSEADLNSANLSNADLRRTNLISAHLVQANLNGTNLTNANLVLTDLNQATLIGATLTRATLFECVLANVDLSRTSGLDACTHTGPSVLDFRTLQQSGALPLKFLRGCGLPDRLIDYLPSLVETGPIRFYSCFISFSTANQDFADRLYADLQSNGVRCWFAPHDMKAGQRIHEQIDEAIRVYDRLLLILSNESIQSSWVKTEIAKARQKERTQKRHVLFPLALVPFDNIRAWEQFDADIGDSSAKEIREYFLPDFSNWKNHDAYQQSFEKRLTGLKSTD